MPSKRATTESFEVAVMEKIIIEKKIVDYRVEGTCGDEAKSRKRPRKGYAVWPRPRNQ